MTEEFPPRPDHPETVETCLRVMRCALEPHEAMYISTPLTTGARAIEWGLNGRSPSADSAVRFREDVIEVNRQEAAAFAGHLRSLVDAIVVDPGALDDVPGWSQRDYRYLWGRVITEFVQVVVFRNGWQLSSGCAYEFVIADRAGVRLLSENLTELTSAEGRRLLEDARGAVPLSESPFLEAVLEALH